MSDEFVFQCDCGSLQGIARDIAIGRVNRVMCYCSYCQAYAHFLEKADTLLDENGGSDIFQMSPGRFEITKGHDLIACGQLTSKGALRWYASCCKSPIANTLRTNQVPFMGINTASIPGDTNGPELDKILGPIRAAVNGDNPKLNTSKWKLITMLFRFSRLLLAWRLRGDHKRSPFFDPETGKPIVKPHYLIERRP